jgi:hypothetical protein
MSYMNCNNRSCIGQICTRKAFQRKLQEDYDLMADIPRDLQRSKVAYVFKVAYVLEVATPELKISIAVFSRAEQD